MSSLYTDSPIRFVRSIYGFHGQTHHDQHGHHDHGGHDKGGEPDQQHLDFDEASNVNDYKIWFAATGAIIAIALCGIFGVLIIPLMQQVFYQHLIQVWIIKATLKVHPGLLPCHSF